MSDMDTDAKIKATLDVWWREQTRKGDPVRNPRLIDEAFRAGFLAGREAQGDFIVSEREKTLAHALRDVLFLIPDARNSEPANRWAVDWHEDHKGALVYARALFPDSPG